MTVSEHPVLQSFCSPEFIQCLQQLDKEVPLREVMAGENLFEFGDPSDDLYLVLEGRFAVHKGMGIGTRTQVVALLGAGAVIGESALASERTRTTTVLAVESSVLACFSHELLHELEERFPVVFISFLKKILSVTSLRLQKSSERLALVL